MESRKFWFTTSMTIIVANLVTQLVLGGVRSSNLALFNGEIKTAKTRVEASVASQLGAYEFSLESVTIEKDGSLANVTLCGKKTANRGGASELVQAKYQADEPCSELLLEKTKLLTKITGETKSLTNSYYLTTPLDNSDITVIREDRTSGNISSKQTKKEASAIEDLFKLIAEAVSTGTYLGETKLGNASMVSDAIERTSEGENERLVRFSQVFRSEDDPTKAMFYFDTISEIDANKVFKNKKHIYNRKIFTFNCSEDATPQDVYEAFVTGKGGSVRDVRASEMDFKNYVGIATFDEKDK